MTLKAGKPEEVGMSPERIARLSELCVGWLAKGSVRHSLVTLVVRRGVIVHHIAIGTLTDQPDPAPVGPDTIYPIASMSKPITATAAMMLVEDGLLSLNVPVRTYISEFTGKDEVEVHHLLTHTSGFNSEHVSEYVMDFIDSVVKHPPEGGQDPNRLKRLHRCWNTPLWKPPGTEMSYSEFGYDVLAEIVMRVAEEPLSQFAKRRIFDPLGMNDTSYVPDAKLYYRIVDYGRRWLDSPTLREHCGGAREAYSTILDMAVFAQMFLNGGEYGGARLLSPAAVAEMTRNQIPGVCAVYGDEVFPEAGWGYGWMVKENKKLAPEGSLSSPRTFRHGGYGGVKLYIDPTYDLICCFFGVMPESLDWKPENHVDYPAPMFFNAAVAAVVEI